MTFYFIKTNEGIIIALREIERLRIHKKVVSVSFYKGISENELEKYLEYIH